MRSGGNEKMQMDPLFPRLSINDTEKGEPRASLKNKMAICDESVSMPPCQLSNNSGSKRSGSQNHRRKSGSSLFCSLSESSSEMSSDHHSRSSTAEMPMLKTVDYQKVSSIRPSKMISDNCLFRPLGFFNSENSSMRTHGKENFKLPKFSELDRTLLCGGDIEDKLRKEKLTSSSSSSSGRREEVNSSDFKSAEHLILTTMFDFGARSPSYQARHDLANAKITLSDPCDQLSQKMCRTSQEKTVLLTDGMYERIEKNSKKRSYSMMESCSNRDHEENNRIVRMQDPINGCFTRDNNDTEVCDAGGRSTSISTSALMMDCKSDSNITPGEVAGIIGLKLFWQIRKTITHQQLIFAVQVFELHRLIKVQRLVAESPEILSEEMLRISNYSTKFSLVNELPTPTISEATSSLMKPKVDSQRPNSRLETTAAAQDVHSNLPLIDCDTKKKGQITLRDAQGPCATRSSTFSSSSSTIKLGSWYLYPGYQCLIPVRSHSEGLFYKHYAGPGPQSSSVYGSCEVPRLRVIDRDFIMLTSGIRPSSQPYAVVEASNSSKSSPASKGSDDVQESMVRSRPASTVHGDALSLFPVGSLFQASYREIRSNNKGKQVIKVVPHNAKLGCESAARIFQSIQEESQKRK